MKALVLKEYGNPVIMDLPVPEIKADEVLIRIHACAICGSDLHGYTGRSGRRQPPIIMGHEASGEIVKVGANVTRFASGNRVVFNSTLFCGKCHYCVNGRENLCESSRVFGVNCDDYKLDGAMAEYLAVPEHILYTMPENLDYVTAALAEPFSIALHAVGRTPIGLNESAIVIGAGAIGLMLIKALKAAGCTKIVALDISDARLTHALRAGADTVVNTSAENAAEQVREIFPKGADHCFEAVGAAVTVNNALDYVKRGGTVTIVGNASPSGQINFQKIVLKEILVVGTYACANEYEIALDLMGSGSMDFSDILSVTAPLEEGKKWLDALCEGKQDIVKVVLTM